MTNHELDIKTATQIMGWHTVSKYSDPQPHQINIVDDNGQPVASAFEKSWSPSTDMNHAMRVVEKMRADDPDMSLVSSGKHWAVRHQAIGIGSGDKSPSRAICLAALSWA